MTPERDSGDDLERMLDINEVAELLNVNVRHIRRLVFERRIPFVKWGRLLRFERRALAKWIEEGRIEPDQRKDR